MARKLKTLGIVEGEMMLLKIFRNVREKPLLTEGEIEHARKRSMKVMVLVTAGMNAELENSHLAWSIIYEQMRHIHTIFHQIVDVLAKRYLGQPFIYPIVCDATTQTDELSVQDFAVQTDVHESDDDILEVFQTDPDWIVEQQSLVQESPVQRELSEGYQGTDEPSRNSTQREEESPEPINQCESENKNQSKREREFNDRWNRGRHESASREQAEYERREIRRNNQEQFEEDRHKHVYERRNVNRGYHGDGRTDCRNGYYYHDSQEMQRDRSSTPSRSYVTRNRYGEPHCWMCNRDHPLHACPTFRAMTSRERLRSIRGETFEMCHNCFCFGHNTAGCRKANGCRCDTGVCQCGSYHRHNSLLCNGYEF